MRKICAKLVPKNLSDEQKDIRVLVSWEILDHVKSEPNFLQGVITGDETWIFEYDPTTKRQSSEWHTSESPRPKKAQMSKSRVKSMLIIFFDSKGIVHKEFVPPGQTVNRTFYLQVLKRLRNRVRRVRAEIADKLFLHHDNAPSHTSFAVREFLSQNKITTLPHPSYSPDLAPCDFILFPKFKTHLKGHHFGTAENDQAAATRALNNSSEDLFHCYDEWQQRWNCCIRSQGAYFEGDKL
jgi:histone-lysine N-methyltransferase SETMAR